MDLSKLPKFSDTASANSEAAKAAPAEKPAQVPAMHIPAGQVPAAQVRASAQHSDSFCRSCGLPIDPYARFCGHCGAALTKPLPAPEAPPLATAAPARDQGAYAAPSREQQAVAAFAEIWIFGIVGLILIFLGSQYGHYLWSGLTHQTMHTGVNWTSGPKLDQEVAYPDLIGHPLWTDSSYFMLGVAMIIAGIASAVRVVFRQSAAAEKIALAVSMTVCAAVTAFEGYRCAQFFNVQVTPLFSLIFMAIGGFITLEQFGAWRVACAEGDPSRRG